MSFSFYTFYIFLRFNKFVHQTNSTIQLTYRVSWWLANWQLWHVCWQLLSLAGISFFCDVHTTHKLL